MCYQVLELYSRCRCLYYQHAVDRCPRYGTRGHGITQRTILVEYSCIEHSNPSRYSEHQSAQDGLDNLSHAALRSGRSSRPHRASQNSTTQTTQKTVPNKPKHDRKPEIKSFTRAPRQGVAKEKPLPDAKQKPSRGREDRSILKSGKSQATMPIGTCSREPFATPDLHNLDRNSIDRKGSVEIFDLTDSDESSSDESVTSKAARISSIASSITPSEREIIGPICWRLKAFQDLRYLWPQLALRHASQSVTVVTIERLLRRYCEDLTNLATSIENLNDSDSSRCLSASRFVRRSRFYIAHRISKVPYQRKYDYSQASRYIKDWIRKPEAESTGSPAENYALDEISDRFLFETEPIAALQSSVKALVESQDSPVDSVSSRLYETAKIHFSNVVSFIYEPPLKPGSQRVRCKCVSFLSVPLRD